MLFFFRRRSGGPFLRGDSSGEQFLRLILLIAIFAVCAYAFWVNTGRSLDAIEARSTVYDPAKLTEKSIKRDWQKFASMFRDEFGLRLRIHIRNTPVELPELDSKTIFLGINPETRQVLVDLPPLVRRALGDEYMYALQNNHFSPYFAGGNWEQGVDAALERLWRDMSGT